MVEKIYNLKQQLLGRIEKEVAASGIDRIDVDEYTKLVDMIKDLSAAEKDCWEADYYRSVTEAMGKQGYSQYDKNGMWHNQYGSGYSERRGYMGHNDMVESVRMAMQGMSPDERERMREQLQMVMK